jgi:hypothetical protein
VGIFHTTPSLQVCRDDGCNADTVSFLKFLASFEIDIASHVVITEHTRTATKNVTVEEPFTRQYEFTEVVNVSVVNNISYLENQTTAENITVEVWTDDICFGPNISYGQNVTQVSYTTREVLVFRLENGTEPRNITTNRTEIIFRNKTFAENFTETYNVSTIYRDTLRISLPGFNAPNFADLVVSEEVGTYQLNASWNSSSHDMILSMDGRLAKLQMLQIVLPSSLGFMLPSAGFPPEYTGVRMQVVTQNINASA